MLQNTGNFFKDKLTNFIISIFNSVQGAMNHRIGDWLPVQESDAKFAQVFTLDTDQEQFDCRTKLMPYLNQHLLKQLQVALCSTQN